jgi:hypothetical protein
LGPTHRGWGPTCCFSGEFQARAMSLLKACGRVIFFVILEVVWSLQLVVVTIEVVGDVVVVVALVEVVVVVYVEVVAMS